MTEPRLPTTLPKNLSGGGTPSIYNATLGVSAMVEATHHTLRELPEDERPRERLRTHGEAALSNTELIAIALQTGSQGENVVSLAQRLLATFHGLAGLASASVGQLCQVPGIGPAKAAQIKAALELGRRLVASGGDARPRISSPAEAATRFLAEMSTAAQEELRVMLLDTKNQVLRTHTVYLGTVNTSMVRPAEVFREPIKDNATSVIIAHNHPSGDPCPSAEDLEVTRELIRLGKTLGIKVLDHLIIGRQRYVSLQEYGLEF